MLNPVVIKAVTIPDAWFQALYNTVLYGRTVQVDKGSTPTKRWVLDHFTAHITRPGTRPFEPEIPPGMKIPPPLEPGYVDKYFPYYIHDINQPREHYTYAQDLSWQVRWLIEYYKKHGYTKHGYMTVGRPESLYFYDEDVDYEEVITVRERDTQKRIRRKVISNECNKRETGTSQCLRGVDTVVTEGKLHFGVHFRSWNLWSAFLANLACLQVMKEYMAQEIGVGDGEMFATCMKLGLQESVFDIAKLRTGLEREDSSSSNIDMNDLFKDCRTPTHTDFLNLGKTLKSI